MDEASRGIDTSWSANSSITGALKATRMEPLECEDDAELQGAEEMVLSREEMDLLKNFHRFVPLPALTSRVIRLVCEEELQVPEQEEQEEADDAHGHVKQDAQSQPQHEPVVTTLDHEPQDAEKTRMEAPAHEVDEHQHQQQQQQQQQQHHLSPLTRRLSKAKPHRSIDLSTLTLRQRG